MISLYILAHVGDMEGSLPMTSPRSAGDSEIPGHRCRVFWRWRSFRPCGSWWSSLEDRERSVAQRTGEVPGKS